jgi:hypothetical protein
MTDHVVRARGSIELGRGVSIATLPAWAAALSLASAIAHLGVAGPHLREWWAYGAFFLACAFAQALFAALILWRPRDWLALTGIAGNLAVITMYVYSRTNGPPLGPHEGMPEDPGVYDLTTTAGELALVVVLLLMLDRRAGRWAMRLVLLVATGLWAAEATGLLA